MEDGKRRVLPGYVGVKFDAACRTDTLGRECAELHALFREQGQKLLRSHGYVATGRSLEAVTNTIVELHLRLLESSR